MFTLICKHVLHRRSDTVTEVLKQFQTRQVLELKNLEEEASTHPTIMSSRHVMERYTSLVYTI